MGNRLAVFLTKVILTISVSTASAAIPRVVLMGGGGYTKSGVSQFVKWSGGKDASILVVCWGTQDPEGSFSNITEAFKALSAEVPGYIESAEIPGAGNFDRGFFLKQLSKATGVFFTGGDQNIIMKRLRADPEFIPAVLTAYRNGVVFGGSSAGTAIMATRMLTGQGDFTVIDPKQVEIAAGLGALEGVLIDQHFIKRQRQNRLTSVLLGGTERIAFGIDEGSALAVENGRMATVLGPEKVIAYDNRLKRNRIQMQILLPGDWYDITKGVSSQDENLDSLAEK